MTIDGKIEIAHYHSSVKDWSKCAWNVEEVKCSLALFYNLEYRKNKNWNPCVKRKYCSLSASVSHNTLYFKIPLLQYLSREGINHFPFWSTFLCIYRRIHLKTSFCHNVFYSYNTLISKEFHSFTFEHHVLSNVILRQSFEPSREKINIMVDNA